ncbi:ammonium transporter [Desulfomicrobium baculatum]|uniref:Diguanylate cyclase/phosphodiesterase with PAS/PAC sensor(S) n=1 Tax=Desulfomicrobium baculatum (strain DSM 4028 / VKM B-1378 / X) TaxID=525897 RepID=C7LQR9_DESBD|nr:ammonium transporter [Desulfomicrobium baculatum]ACU89148.1 diguanylate cyclase/phosphodiesterase with PAS/PAC sensor(s) [Desulfomicrobium baculatum DSM 4028]
MNNVDMLWIIISASLVFLMQPGFMCLESGMTRSKNSINVAIKNFADFVLSAGVFWLLGFGLMFGDISWEYFRATGFAPTLEDATGFKAAFFFFQVMFCGTATTIFSGAVAERMRFSSYLIVALVFSLFVYPLFGHWAWHGMDAGQLTGWLGEMGFVDFAGSMVVHGVGGWLSLAALLVVGPRQGRFPADGPPREINAGNLPLTVLGAFLLWLGWFGFNGGSTLALNQTVPHIIVRTVLAGIAGGASNMLLGWMATRTPKITYLVNGVLGGLVAVTASCHAVSNFDAVCIGLVAGAVCLGCELLLVRLRIDDAVGAVPVHLGCGIWGILAVALFGDPAVLQTGLSMTGQLWVQCLGIFAAFGVAFVVPFVVLRFIDPLFPLRVAPEDEDTGLNVSEHGAHTDIHDLFEILDRQAATRDFSLRAPEEPFTEVGHIAHRYNHVLDALHDAVSKTEAIVKSAADAIIVFTTDTLRIISANPGASFIFGHPALRLEGMTIPELLPAWGIPGSGDNEASLLHAMRSSNQVEVTGRRANGSQVTLEAVITQSSGRQGDFFIGTFRDISERKRYENELRKAEENFRGIFENAVEGMFRTTPHGRYLQANPALAKIYGFESPAELMRHYDDISRQLYVEAGRREEFIRLLGEKEEIFDFESAIRRKDGSVIWISENARAVKDAAGNVVCYEGTVMDITQRRAMQQALDRQMALFGQLFEDSPLAIALVDTVGRIAQVNGGFETLFGYKRAEILGKDNRLFIVPEEQLSEINSIRQRILDGETVQRETLRRTSRGDIVPVNLLGHPVRIGGEITNIFWIYQDISERKEFERQITHQAFHDSLTGLPNRSLFRERLGRAVERTKRRPDYHFAAMLIDLNKFKWVNDSLGHQAGDALLVEIASRLKSCVRSVDTVARLGGDEFAILLEEFRTNKEVISVASRIQNEVRRAFLWNGKEIVSGASVGIVLQTRDCAGAEDILRDADIAMYKAKERGRGHLVFHNRMRQEVLEVINMENELRRAIEGNSLELHYQPIFDVDGGKLEGFEALVRWRHPEHGMIMPDRFIPLAEESGLIVPLGQWVVNAACRQLKSWDDESGTAEYGLTMSVNLSCKQFAQHTLVDMILRALRENDIAPPRLKLEITESAIILDPAAAAEKLRRLKEIGVLLAVDDFGTGYSSLSYLRQFPMDILKIDRSFISGTDTPKENAEIVRSIVDMAHSLGLRVTAEGVETQEQLERLQSINCDRAQGYMFSKPMAPGDAGDMIRQAVSEGVPN